MNVANFFNHWNITENPFRGEEARHDSVFARIGFETAGAPPSTHSDFEKILGELSRPSTSIVFGEKGSGKTAIRLQIVHRVRAQNAQHPSHQTFLVSYDDLNPFLEQIHSRMGGNDPAASLRAVRLIDHLDAILALAVTELTDTLTGAARTESINALGPEVARTARSFPPAVKNEFRILQALYDQRDTDGHRTSRLRRALRVGGAMSSVLRTTILLFGWVPSVALAGAVLFAELDEQLKTIAAYAALGFGVLYLLAALKLLFWNRFRVLRLARRVRKHRRALPREESSYAASLAQLPLAVRAQIAHDDNEASRYALLASLHRVLDWLGFSGILVLVDRVDEPTLINGDTQRMQSIIWPMLNNKFLQQERMGLKMLLPVELRYALFKESNAFFQEARLDKQSFIERLSWTGAMLYDLCNARLNACRPADLPPISLLDLFAEDVTRQDLVDALDQMHQPRDALKFLYRCLNEHCSNVTAEDGSWRIPKLVLDNCRRQEVERVQQLYRGIRPA